MSGVDARDRCGRCGKARSWHLGLGGLGVCVPFDGDPPGTGGFVEPKTARPEPRKARKHSSNV